jgi:Zn-dependent protease with chaperone function
MIKKSNEYIFIVLLALAPLIAILFFSGCVFDIRQLPGMSIAVIGMFCAFFIATACLALAWFFMRSFGQLSRGQLVVSRRAGLTFASVVFVYFVVVTECVKKICH